MIVSLIAASGGYLDDIKPADVPAFERYILSRIRTEHGAAYQEINQTEELSQETRDLLAGALTEYRAAWTHRRQPR
jgi:F0F1-type ATP synthase alpha subunit